MFQRRREEVALRNSRTDSIFGFDEFTEGPEKMGYLLNMLPITTTGDGRVDRSGVELFFLEQNGNTFKTTLLYPPYFYVGVDDRFIREVTVALEHLCEGKLDRVETVMKEDLDMPNHLSGKRRAFLKLCFFSVRDLMDVRKRLMPQIKKSMEKPPTTISMAPENRIGDDGLGIQEERPPDNALECLNDIREYDVPYVTRVSIDKDLRVACWYLVSPLMSESPLELTRQPEFVENPFPRVLAFDIECTKAPLKFPDRAVDQVYMISYMADGQGYLITNREVVSEDVEDFEYTPKPEYPGPFKVFNEKNEKELLIRFFEHVRELRPNVFVTYNGDFFDWPFIEARAEAYGLSMVEEIGVEANRAEEYRGRTSVHLDCYYWVKRDSYLPQGSHGLKKVTKAKLDYDPVEIDPEDMLPFAAERPRYMASYSVSDAVATYYLYMKYVHNFIFSLCTIIPMGADDVLRKGSGTLCEMLLQVEAYTKDIICPNKEKSSRNLMYEGHLVETETYIGGHVECLLSGVYRSDLPAKFEKIDPKAFEELIEKLDTQLKFALEVEEKVKLEEVENYDEVRAAIVAQLEGLRDRPKREETPKIYHLDVAAMYPNIILTNRLQPCAMVTDDICAACCFNPARDRCQRTMTWTWRGEYYPASRQEYLRIKTQLQSERHPKPDSGGFGKKPQFVEFHELHPDKQDELLRKRVKEYSQKVYKRTKITKVKDKASVICQRENPFYVDTVRAFRDRRYEYKNLTKVWNKKREAAQKMNDAIALEQAKSRCVLYDSLQLAHKCILNSFYGYVMRRGARWHSMQMAGVVTYTGAALITQARELVERIGLPLELDTDGIWCILPSSFPENFTFKLKSGRAVTISYPCVMLNADVHSRYTNDQYQDLVDKESLSYSTKSECSIFFEVDGPYRCMAIPASTEEGRLLKKRYAVFNFDGSIAELKGFELKRRGELNIIKIFQEQLFQQFLKGSTLQKCYDAVGSVCNYWLNILYSQGEDLDDDELIDLISERKNMSRKLEDYGAQKSLAITTAKRLGEFLGPEMVEDKGLNCHFVIARDPIGTPVTERAIPVAILKEKDESIKRSYIRRWTKNGRIEDMNIRSLLDWSYYIDRLTGTIQRIVTIPAALQEMQNPVPMAALPDWVKRQIAARTDTQRQLKLDKFFVKKSKAGEEATKGVGDIEDLDQSARPRKGNRQALITRLTRKMMEKRGLAVPEGALTAEERQKRGAEEKSKPVSELETLTSKLKDVSSSDLVKMAKAAAPETDFSKWYASRRVLWNRNRRAKRKKDASEVPPQQATPPKEATGGSRRRQGVTFLDKAQHARERQLMPRKRARRGRNDLTSLFAAGQLDIVTSLWQIIEVRETRTPGEMQVWFLTGPASLHNVKLRVDRRVYLRCKTGEALAGAPDLKLVQRDIPRGSGVQVEVYEISFSEHRFRRRSKAVHSLLNNKSVTGMYESNVPLLFRVLMEAGCCAQLTNEAMEEAEKRVTEGNGLSNVYVMDNLQAVDGAEESYLSTFSSLYRRLYCIQAGGSLKSGIAPPGILILFDLPQTNVQRGEAAEDGGEAEAPANPSTRPTVPLKAVCYVWLIGGRKANAAPDFARIVDTLDPLGKTLVEFAPVRRCKTLSEALVEMNARLTAYKTKNRGNVTLLINDSVAPFLEMERLCPSISQFPCVHRFESPVADATSEEQRAGLAMRRFLTLEVWWQMRLKYARFGAVPVGNIPSNAVPHVLDIRFSRLLKSKKHLLWISPGRQPDFGGTEGEMGLLADTPENPVVSSPGFYSGICCDLSIDNLSVAAILAVNQIESIEGVSMTGLGVSYLNESSLAATMGGRLEGLDDDTRSIGAFRLLRTLVVDLFTQMQRDRDVFADLCLIDFYCWLCSSSSLLFDPLLHTMVQKIMVKLFALMLGEIRKMGGVIVFASFSRVIVGTGRTNYEDAAEYIASVCRNLQANELFRRIVINPQAFFSHMIFKDIQNRVGVIIRPDAPLNQRHSVAFNLLLVNAFPKQLYPYFQVVLGHFVNQLLKFDLTMAAEREQRRLAGVASQQPQPLSGKSDADRAREKAMLIVKDWLPLQVKRAVDDFRRKELDEFPAHPGIGVNMVSHSLEFVKAICYLISLDHRVESQIRSVRRMLLKMIGVKEFAPEARFEDPFLSFRLSNVICQHCRYCRDVDLLRDADFKISASGVCEWKCANCGGIQDRAHLEQRVVQLLLKDSVAYQMQDLICKKCRGVKNDSLPSHCSCSGDYLLREGRAKFNDKLKVFSHVARLHGFQWLLETIQSIAQ